MIEYNVYCWIAQCKGSFLMTKVKAKTTKAAFTQARKLLNKVHSSCIRVERVENDPPKD